MYLEKRKTRMKLTSHRIESSKCKNLPYHAEKIRGLYNFFLVAVLCGPNTVLRYKMSRLGKLKEHKFLVPDANQVDKATTKKWYSPGVIMKIYTDL